jgi:DnaK suppressor protein
MAIYRIKMTATQKNELKEHIKNELIFLKNEISELLEKTKPIAPDCSLGRLTREEMMIEQQIYIHSLHEAEIRINKLKFALSKVDKEEYGVCMECEEDIAFERLLLLPESTHCVPCRTELNL